MREILLFTVIAVLGFNTINAQDEVNNNSNEFTEMARGGSVIIGTNIGIPLIGSGYDSSFNFGVDIAYLFEVIDNLEVGGIVGYTHFIGTDDKVYYDIYEDDYFIADYKDASFIIVSGSSRYYFSDHKFFGGLDLGIGINVSGDAKTGVYYRPKFGFDLGVVALIASFQGISGGVDYSDNNFGGTNVTSSGFNSVNFGVEFGF